MVCGSFVYRSIDAGSLQFNRSNQYIPAGYYSFLNSMLITQHYLLCLNGTAAVVFISITPPYNSLQLILFSSC